MISAPTTTTIGPARWARENLFSTWYNSMLSLLFGALLGWAALRGLRLVFVTARWEIIRVNLTSLLVGLFPRDELWRPWTMLYLVTLATSALVGSARTVTLVVDGVPSTPSLAPGQLTRRGWPIALLLAAVVTLRPSPRTIILIVGLVVTGFMAWHLGARMPRRWIRWTWLGCAAMLVVAFVTMTGGPIADGVGWDRWGGLLLTVFLAIGGIVLCFPFGVLLALGRRSTLPVVRAVCVGFIELFRGFPLVTLLFMGAFVIGFLFPQGFSRPSLVTRALIAIVLFESAYVAEIVRGGLQAVGREQVEAGLALGLSRLRTIRSIVLPQAFRAVIPALVGQFIALFKDTSLVAIVGLSELLRVAQRLTTQGQFLAQGLHAETLVFASFVYWVFAYSMSKESQRLEQRLGVGQR